MTFDIPYQHRNASGIYAILNLINRKVYVGSTRNFRKRFWHHCFYLRTNKHQSSKLLRAVNKSGIENFSFTLLEVAGNDLLAERENFWIAKFNATTCGYNICLECGSRRGVKATEETKQKISISNSGKVRSAETRALLSNTNPMKGMFGFDNIKSKPVKQFDLKGNFIQTFGSISEAGRIVGFHASKIITAIKNKRPSHGFIWSYATEPDAPELAPLPKRKDTRQIQQLSKVGVLINTFDSLTDAQHNTGVSDSKIVVVCKGQYGRKTAGGFIWKYAA